MAAPRRRSGAAPLAALAALALAPALAVGADEPQTRVRGSASPGAITLPVHSVDGFESGDAIRIEAGTLTERHRISAVHDGAFELDPGLRFEHTGGEAVVRLGGGEWSSTVTTADVHRGARTLPVSGGPHASFAAGQQVRIISDGGTEWDTVGAVGERGHELLLQDGLLFSHPAGAEVLGEADAGAEAEAPLRSDATRGVAEANSWLEQSKATESSHGRLVTETSLKGEAQAGDGSLEVGCVLGFQEGDSVRVEGHAVPRGSERVSEVQRVSGVDHGSSTIHLEAPLTRAHPEGAAVVREEEHILGEYGFLSQFDGITEHEARQRVRRLASGFGVREFEFYNAFKGYSDPPADDEEEWRCACFGTRVRRSLLRAYTDEIEKVGGRSWLAVVGMATDPGDAEAQQGTHVIGHQAIEGRSLLDVVEPTGELARSIAQRWARFATGLGFSGLHWATVDGYASGGAVERESDVQEFLRESGVVLRQHGLEQTWSFLNGFGWSRPLVSEGVIAFTVWQPLDHVTDPLQALGAGVVKSFPEQEGEDSQHALDRLSELWARARCRGLRYLAVGDGSRILRNDYYPSARAVSDEGARLLNDRVFGELVCSSSSQPSGGEIQRGVMLATVEGAGGSQVGRDEHPMLEGVLEGLFGYSRCHVVAWQEIDDQSEEAQPVRARRLTGGGSSLFEVPFVGLCDRGCVDHRPVAATQVRDALQQGLQSHGVRGRVESVRMVWDEYSWGVGARGHRARGFRALGIGEHNLWYIAVCALAVVALCVALAALELCWHRRAGAREAARREAFPGPSRGGGAETDPLARKEDALPEPWEPAGLRREDALPEPWEPAGPEEVDGSAADLGELPADGGEPATTRVTVEVLCLCLLPIALAVAACLVVTWLRLRGAWAIGGPEPRGV